MISLSASKYPGFGISRHGDKLIISHKSNTTPAFPPKGSTTLGLRSLTSEFGMGSGVLFLSMIVSDFAQIEWYRRCVEGQDEGLIIMSILCKIETVGWPWALEKGKRNQRPLKPHGKIWFQKLRPQSRTSLSLGGGISYGIFPKDTEKQTHLFLRPIPSQAFLGVAEGKVVIEFTLPRQCQGPSGERSET